ncbi:MAG: nicotinate-nucleotide adenylyltransferase [Acidobacteria bacterium]|nr:nicotinate-nucleotide adenylyltransferase [Acidobacteriota bacterium]MSO60520.1 nicotinate-nucleotide adenylyltransferase [Acidobacteriota bacterium]
MTLGVLGGTFDPIHNGHITAGLRAQAALRLDRVMLVPSRIPPHRATAASASPEARLAMAELAAAEQQGWTASDIELTRNGPSYTFDTLTALRATSTSQFFFIIGADAFAEIATWSRYPAVLDLAHFAVVARPGITLHSLQARVPDLADRMTTPDLFKPQAPSPTPDGKTRVILIETATPDVSSTEIRRRVRAGESIGDLVPASVAAYVSTHRLYVGAAH